MTECDFYDCDLKEAKINNCNILGAIFENTNLYKTDFRSSYNLMIDIERNNIKKAKFNFGHTTGLLAKWDIELS